MDRYRFIPIIILIASLVVLLTMFLVKVFSPAAPSGPDPAPTENPADVGEMTPSPEPTETPVPSETEILEPTSTIFVPTFTPNPKDKTYTEPPEGCNVAGFVADITAPDGTVVDRKIAFIKTWRLTNDGTCTWNSDYKLYFHSGDQLSGPDSQRLTEIDVPPGATIDVSVTLRAPSDPGIYKGYWALKDGGDFPFGISTFNNPFYLKIVVK